VTTKPAHASLSIAATDNVNANLGATIVGSSRCSDSGYLAPDDGASAYVSKGLVTLSFAFAFYLGISVVFYVQPHGPFEALLLAFALPELVTKIVGDANAERQSRASYVLGIPAVWRILRWWGI
jgi:hypothetical protein